ncbi:DUF5405 family protein [Ewingella sp. S1.OA.A_B6]
MNRQIIDGKYAISFLKPRKTSPVRQLSLQQIVIYKGDSKNPCYEVMAIYDSEVILTLDLIRHHMGTGVFAGGIRSRAELGTEFVRLSELCDLALVNLKAGASEPA